jgi:hypothetical protein
MAKDKIVSGVQFGIEVECHIPRGVLGDWGTRRQNYHAGVTMAQASRHWRGPEILADWRAERDGSLPEGRQRMGIEMISPVYSWPDDLPIMMAAVREIRKAGATTSRACGGHITLSFDRDSVGTGAWESWQAEMSYRQAIIVRPMRAGGWRHEQTSYADAGMLYCGECDSVGACTCYVPEPRQTYSGSKHCRPGAIYLKTHASRYGRYVVEARAWKGSVSGSRWASRLGATMQLLGTDPRMVAPRMADWARRHASYHSPYRDPNAPAVVPEPDAQIPGIVIPPPYDSWGAR